MAAKEKHAQPKTTTFWAPLVEPTCAVQRSRQ